MNAVTKTEDEAFVTALQAGDVDSLRRLLRKDAPTPARPAPQRPGSPQNIYQDLPHIIVQVGSCSLKLVRTKVMGKVVWPAGHAMALFLLNNFASDTVGSDVGQACFVEIGAGSALTSLVVGAACTRRFPLTLATDFTETGMQLIEANAILNASSLERSNFKAARFNVKERLSLASLLNLHAADSPRDVT